MAINATGSLLEMCVLAAVAREDVYGYALTQLLKDRLGISESTIYPVMRRLQTQHCLEMYDVPCDGRNRRYYRLTGLGRERLTALTDDWADFKERIDTILAKGERG